MLFKVCLPQSSEPDRQLLCACWELLLVKLASLSLIPTIRGMRERCRGRQEAEPFAQADGAFLSS